MFNWTCGNWTYDLGYNFWGRSCEKLKLSCECPTTFAENTWVLVGDASEFGCENGGEARALSASENNATITSGTNFTASPPFTDAQRAFVSVMKVLIILKSLLLVEAHKLLFLHAQTML